VIRFFAYGDGLEDYEEEVSPFLSAYAKQKNQEFTAEPSLVVKYRDQFAQVMAFVSKTFPNGFRRSATGKATPRSRFEAIAVGSLRALKDRPSLQANLQKGQAIIDDPEFARRVRSDAANVMKPDAQTGG